MTAHLRLELPVRAAWHGPDGLQGLVSTALRGVVDDDEAHRALVLTADELIANALQHGAWELDGAGGRVSMVRVVADGGGASISVENPVATQGAPAPRLLAELSRIAEVSAEQAYVDRLRVLAVGGGNCGLGLARVAFEGGCRLSAEVSTDGWLRVTATRPLP